LLVGVKRIARVATEVLRLTFARESLGDEAGSPTRKPRAPGRFLRLLFAIEPLPMDPPAASRRRATPLGGLFASEALPQDPAPPSRNKPRGLFHALFAPERLPQDPAPAAAPRASRLAKLFALEKLDDSQ
jgi:hypothetical protein